MPLISFIVTYYNLPLYMLKECIESIVSLSITNDEREIILIDDGSNSSPLNCISEYREHITYIRKENGGLSDARNHGLKIAKGKYIQFVDGDDILLKNEYNKCLDIIKNNEVDMLIFRLTNNKKEGTSKQHIITNGLHYMQNNNICSTACGYLFNKSILGSLSFTKGIFHEDDEFTPLLMIKAGKLHVTDYKAYWYRERANSITSSTSKERIEKRLNDKRDIIFRLQNTCIALDIESQKALTRRISQLTMDYIYTCIIDIRNSDYIHKRLKELGENNLYPLPEGNYTLKYKWFRYISSKAIGVLILFYLLPL